MRDHVIAELRLPVVPQISSPVAPVLVSQRNCEPTCGVSPRVFLDHLRRPDFDVDVVRLGKLRMVDPTAYVAWLRREAARLAEEKAREAAVEVDGVAATLAEFGMVSR